MSDDIAKQEALQKIRASGIKPGQHYRHYATGDIYVVRDVGLFEAGLEPMVSYRLLNAEDDDPIWMRYLTIFGGHAIHGGIMVSRFSLID